MSRRSHASLQVQAGFAAAALILALAPAVARAQGAPADTVVLAWTAPGDDGPVGTASIYEVRMSVTPIDDASWSSANIVSGPPAPLPAGTRQSMVVRGLTYGTPYYFAIKTADEAGNWSELSNVLLWDWVYDTAPPAAPSGLGAAAQSLSEVQLIWSANTEPDLAGYTVYRALGTGGPFIALNGTLIATPGYVDATIPSGTGTVRYQVSASDHSGNESARSSTTSVTLAAEADAWTIAPCFPNPSGPGAIVRIPLVAPAGGGSARVEIVNNIGQRVRRMETGDLPPGPSEIRWNGQNDAGRDTAPGAYTVWLIAGQTRIGVRLVRIP